MSFSPPFVIFGPIKDERSVSTSLNKKEKEKAVRKNPVQGRF
jgi:hypothetical protein